MKVTELFTKTTFEGSWTHSEYTDHEGDEISLAMYNDFEHFLKNNPRFNDATVEKFGRDAFIKNGVRVYPFRDKWREVDNLEMYLIKLKGRTYAFGYRRTDFYSRGMTKFVFKRFYPADEVKPTRKRKGISFKKVEVAEGSDPINAVTYRSDCQIRALAAATGIDYYLIHNEMSKMGWSSKDTGNTNTYVNNVCRWDEILKMCGYKREEVWDNYSVKNGCESRVLNGVKGMTVKTAVAKLPKGRFIISVRSHVCTVVNNELYDSWNSQNCRVRRIFRITKI